MRLISADLGSSQNSCNQTSERRVAVPFHTAPVTCGRNSASRSIQRNASRRSAASSAGWVSA